MNQNKTICVSIICFSFFLLLSCQSLTSEIDITPKLPSLEENKTPEPIGTGPTVSSDNTINTSVAIEENVEIEFWHPWSGELAEMMDEFADEYNTENPWANKILSRSHADQDVLIEDFFETLDNGETIPDLIVSSSQSLQTWYSNGYSIRELDELLEMLPVENDGKRLSQIFPVFWNIDISNERRIGIPAYQSGNFLFYNQTWGEELGFLDAPQTLEEFQEQACAAEKNNRFDKEIENNGTGGWIYSRKSLPLLAWLKVFGGGTLINSRSQPILVEPENIDALRFIYDLFRNDCAWTGKQQKPYTYFSERFALFYSGQMEDIVKQIQMNEASGSKDNWKLIPYPSTIGKPVVMVDGLSFAVTSEDNGRALAVLDFVRWMMTPEKQAQIIEKTGIFPLSNETVELVDKESPQYSVWRESLQFLPYAFPEPNFERWYAMEKVLEDIGWQLVQFSIQEEKIEELLSNANTMLAEIR